MNEALDMKYLYSPLYRRLGINNSSNSLISEQEVVEYLLTEADDGVMFTFAQGNESVF